MKFIKILALVFSLLLLFFTPSKSVLAQETIRISGFDYPRNLLPFYNPHILYEGEPIPYPLGDAINDENNFGGEGAVVPCNVSWQQFKETLSPGSLVQGGQKTTDIFIAGTINSELSPDEALEIKAFLESGGVVFISAAPPGFEHADYHTLFEILGIEDRFSEEFDQTDIFGVSHIPIDTPITSGSFGNVGKFTHTSFRIFNHSSLSPIAKSFLEKVLFTTLFMPMEEFGGYSDNYLLFEKKIGDGYLSVAGEPLYANTDENENTRYFLNLLAYACGNNDSSAIQPFLDLPWNYELKGMTFSQAALSMSSYFDHEYPLLSTNLIEPNQVFIYEGVKDNRFAYTSHDGYDWGSKAQTKEGTPVLAAAGGTASFRSSCSPCGNAIFIDHQNGFQTRYYHLKNEGLIINQPGQTVEVSQGEQIGLVGHTGNVQPRGEVGSHIHFMVVQDKNGDGNFDDNIPDGIVDPFGWQSNRPDPWPNYSFFYNGQERTGNVSYYLWTKAIANLSAEFDSNGGFFNLENFGVSFPQNTVDSTHKVNLKAAGGVHVPYETVGYPLDLTIIDNTGNPATHFPTPYTITIDFSSFDISRLLQNSLSIYSSEDGLSWKREETTFDWENKSASANLDHASYFVLAGEKKDTTAPTTTATLLGEPGEVNWYRSDVELSLTSYDNKDGSGIEYIAYRVNNDEWKEYSQPLKFYDEGEYTVEFYSVDIEENVETTKSVSFNIDKTPPEATIYFNEDSLKVESEALDANKTTSNFQKTGILNSSLKVDDIAGNQLTMRGKYLSLFTNTAFSISSISYNSSNFNVDDNLYNVVYKLDRKTKKITSINQSYLEKDKIINIFYYAKENKSYIYIKENGQITANHSQNGLVTLYIDTNNGKLNHRYE